MREIKLVISYAGLNKFCGTIFKTICSEIYTFFQ